MNKFFSSLLSSSLLITLGFASVCFTDVFIKDVSYDKEQQKLHVDIACGCGYEHELFDLSYGRVKQTMPMEVTAILIYSGVLGTMPQGACETTLDFDVANTVKPIYINVVTESGNSSSRVFVD